MCLCRKQYEDIHIIHCLDQNIDGIKGLAISHYVKDRHGNTYL